MSRTTSEFAAFDPMFGNTLLDWAALNPKDQAVLDEILKRKLGVDTLIKAARSPLATAIQCRNVAGAKKLLAAGANPNLATGSPKILPLHFAVQTGQLSVVRKLIQTGADIDAPSVDMKMTALHYACLQDRWDIS